MHSVFFPTLAISIALAQIFSLCKVSFPLWRHDISCRHYLHFVCRYGSICLKHFPRQPLGKRISSRLFTRHPVEWRLLIAEYNDGCVQLRQVVKVSPS